MKDYAHSLWLENGNEPEKKISQVTVLLDRIIILMVEPEFLTGRGWGQQN